MHVFAIDYRSLALFRITVGLVVLCSLSTFATVADMFLAADGVITDGAVRYHHRGTWTWSAYWLYDSTWFRYAVLALTGAAAVSLVIGWRTRLSSILTWVLFASLHVHETPVIGGGEILLTLLLFWGMFLPLGARWSLDARNQPAPEEQSLTSAAATAVLLQMAMMYFFTGLSKCNDIWIGGSALDVAFSIDRATRPLGHILAGYPGLTSLLTRATLLAELILPFLLFSPWKLNWCRTIALLMLMSLHIGIELTMVVVMFSWASLAGLTSFIPTVWWEYPPLKQLQTSLDSLFGVAIPQQASKPKKRQKERQAKRVASERLGLRQLLVQAAIVVLILYVLLYNLIAGYASPDLKRSLGSFQRWGELLVLKQYWDMFGDPTPNCNDIACVARLRDGTQIDLLRGNLQVTDRESPPAQPAKYDRFREMVFASIVSNPNYSSYLKNFMQYLCRNYHESNTDPDKEIVECYLMFYPYGPHPYAEKAESIQLASLRPRG